jgi:hypothetical protein
MDREFVALLVMAAAVSARALWVVRRTRQFLARAAHTSGQIVSVSSEESQEWKGEGQGSDTVTTYYPHVRFVAADGTSIEFRSKDGRPQRPGIGQAVRVVYDPARPANTAEIAGKAVWLPALLWGFFAIAAMLAVLIGLLGQACHG